MTLLLYNALNKKIFKKYEEKSSKLSFTFCRRSNEDKNTPLHEAAKKGNTVEARHLIEQGTDVTAKNELEETPLHLAAQYGNIEIVKILVEKDSVSVNIDLLRNKEINVKFSLGGKKPIPCVTLLLYGALNKKIFKKYEEKPSKLSFTFRRRSKV